VASAACSGLAFHPTSPSNGRFFVNYTDRTATPSSPSTGARRQPDDRRPGLGAGAAAHRPAVRQPQRRHARLRPDGYLYISTGDGGGGGDPLAGRPGSASLLGKILRIDVDGRVEPYAIPPDNPFAGPPMARCPRSGRSACATRGASASTARLGDLFIGDVGQDRWEEVNAEPAGEGGRNYGWSVMEGPECFRSDCDPTGLTMPVAWYADGGRHCAITGGYVYRGTAVGGLRASTSSPTTAAARLGARR
jgi:glucose/arabinose dehydrogenase